MSTAMEHHNSEPLYNQSEVGPHVGLTTSLLSKGSCVRVAPGLPSTPYKSAPVASGRRAGPFAVPLPNAFNEYLTSTGKCELSREGFELGTSTDNTQVIDLLYLSSRISRHNLSAHPLEAHAADRARRERAA